MVAQRWLITAMITDSLPLRRDLHNVEREYFITVEEAGCVDVVGLPVYMDFYQNRRVGTIVKSTVIGRAWMVQIAVCIDTREADVRVGVREFVQRVMQNEECDQSLRHVAYELSTRLVHGNPKVALAKTILCFSFVHDSALLGSCIVDVKKQCLELLC